MYYPTTKELYDNISQMYYKLNNTLILQYYNLNKFDKGETSPNTSIFWKWCEKI